MPSLACWLMASAISLGVILSGAWPPGADEGGGEPAGEVAVVLVPLGLAAAAGAAVEAVAAGNSKG